MLPMSDPLAAHLAHVDALGVDPPDDWSELVDRWQAYLRLQSPATAHLAAAVVDGTGGLPALRAQALAEAAALPPARAQVDDGARRRARPPARALRPRRRRQLHRTRRRVRRSGPPVRHRRLGRRSRVRRDVDGQCPGSRT